MKKVLIQVISVITLVFGTCYQSVLALANDSQRIELSGVQLKDAQGNAPRQAKVDDKYQLEMTVTINNKDGDQQDGKAAVWLPEDQLQLLKDQVETTATVPDTNAKLIFERRKSKDLQVRWENVTTQATFQLHLPVSPRTTMTSMALPLAVGTQKGVLQPLTVVGADTDDDQLAEAGEATGLPTDLLSSLDSFIQAQQAQEAAAAEAKAKQEAEAQAKAEAEKQKEQEAAAKKAAAEEEAEAQREAEKKAEQDAADKEKEAAKTEAALKTHKADASAEAKNDGAARETNDQKTTRAGKDLGKLLQSNTDPKDKTLFDAVKITANGQTYELDPSEPTDISDLENFNLIYEWDSESLLKKLNNIDVHNGDYYDFRIYGLEKFNGSRSGSITDNGNVEYATWTLTEGEDDQGKYQEIRVTFTNESMNRTQVKYQMSFEQKYTGNGPIDFEYNDEASWTVDPSETKALLAKSGKFIGNNQIEWTVTLTNEGQTMFSDLKLNDTLLHAGTSFQDQSFVADIADSWTVKYQNIEGDLKGNFDLVPDGKKLTLNGKGNEEVLDDLVFTFRTSYEAGTTGTFANRIGGKIGEKITLAQKEATISTASLSKSSTGYADGIYSWNAQVTLNLGQYATAEERQDALQSLKLTDTISGAHAFDAEQLDLKIVTGGNKDVTDLFDYQIDGKELVITPKNDTISDLISILGENENTLTLTYKTVESGEGAIGNEKNSIRMEMDDSSQDKGSSGTGDQLIVKNGELIRDVYQDDSAHIKWTVKVNEAQRKFNQLTVIDLLPEGATHEDVSNILINNQSLDDVKGVQLTNGSVKNDTQTGKNLYNFEENENNARKALKFVFDQNYSGEKITITFETKHAWASSYKNDVGATTGDRWDYTYSTVNVGERILKNAYKDSRLNLVENDPESSKNNVTWTIGIGSRLNTVFGTKDDQINQITIKELLNRDGPKYLSFPENADDYKLYKVSNKGEKEAEIPKSEYTVKWSNDPETDQRTFTIEFNSKADDKGYSFLEFEFSTPINLRAWEEENPEGEKLPDTHIFYNDALVSYKGQDEMKVGSSVPMSSTGIYGQKTVKGGKTNEINWEVILNALGRDIGKPTITDTLTGNHLHSISPDDFELSLVDVIHEKEGNHYKVEVDKNGDTQKLVRDEDYTIEINDNQMTIKLLTNVDRPLALNYKTFVSDRSDTYQNHVEISAKGQSTSFDKSHTLSGSAFMTSWGVRFQKINGETGDPLEGAKFKLQWKVGGEWTDAEKLDGSGTYGTVTSNEQGYVQFHLMGTLTQYRLVEVGTPAGFDSQMPPMEFDFKRAQTENWQTNTPQIKNYSTSVGNLTLAKQTKNLDESKSFKFEIQAVDDNGNVDTNFHGTYDLESGGQVTFENGVSESIQLTGGQSRTIRDLPIEKVAADGTKSDRHYVVRETSHSDDYTTQVTVNNQTVAGTTSPAFTLTQGSATAVIVHFLNTAAKGDLELKKTVSSDVAADHTRDFQFTIKADDAQKVAGKSYDAEGVTNSVTFNDQGEAKVTMRDNQNLRVKNLPEGVKFNVTEEPADKFTTTWSLNGQEYGTGPSDLTIDANKVQLITFKNAKVLSGQLQVEKQIAGAVKDDQAFKFQIQTDPNLNGSYPYATYHVDTQKPGPAGQIEFKNGQATLELTGQQYAVISELPLDTKYTVSEVDPDVPGMTTTWQAGSNKGEGLVAQPITLQNANEIANATFTNALPNGSLRLTKKVVSQHVGDQTIGFKFEIQAADEDVDLVKGREFQVDSGNQDSISFNDDGLATATLAGNESLVIKGLPADVTLKVTEVNYGDFQASYNIGGGNAVESNVAEVAIKDDGQTTVNYTNTRPGEGSLLLEKRAEGQFPTSGKVDFTVTADDKDLNKTFDAQVRTVNGDPVSQKVTFENGVANVSFKPGETMLIKHLPEQDYQVTEAKQADNVVTSWETDQAEGNGLTADKVGVTADTTSRVMFINKVQTGDLTLNKWVTSHDDADLKKEFKFTITAADADVALVANKSYKATGLRGSDSVKFDENGQAEVQMTDKQQVTITGLPHGIHLTVNEADYGKLNPTWNVNNQGGYQDLTAANTPEVTIDEDQTQVVSYKNVRDLVGSLRVDKVVTGAETDEKRTYEFTVATELKADDDYKLIVYDRNSGQSLHTDTIQFTDGQASFKLAADQYAVINGLPLGDYQVRETDPQVANMTTTWQVNNEDIQTGLATTPQTVTENGVPRITFTNQLHTGDLVLGKQVTGDATDADKNRDFEFKVTAQKSVDGDWTKDESVNGQYTATRATSDGQQTTTSVTFDKGELKVNLKANERLQISNLPSDMHLVATETPVDDYVTSHQINSGKVVNGNTSDVVAIQDGKDQHVKFINHRHSGNLVLEKQVTGETTEADLNQTFEFTVTAQKLDGDDWIHDKSVTGKYPATKTGANGQQTTSVTFDQGKFTVHLKANERLEVGNLPNDMRVVVTETPASGYVSSYRLNGGRVITGNTSDVVMIEDGLDQHVTFINDRPKQDKPAWLALTKSVLGAVGERDRNFNFTVRFLDVNLAPLSGTLDTVRTTSTGGYETNQMMLKPDGSTQIALADGETIRWQLPNGTHYQITEDDYSADGYVTSVSQGLAPERSGLTTTGVVTNSAPADGKVVYYNRAEPTPDEDQPTTTDDDTDTSIPGGSGSTTTALPGGTSGTTGSAGTTAGGSKGILPQTGEWLAQNWLMVLGILILVSLLGIGIKRMWKRD
ncbi:DUF7601 domain-containing protein [Secundilactobacillus folii]|uniref:Gram-positive cocci surface proteins LPxTG domain-containing protein n=1 Tax=Secundilactobacillus folii TaxID=2678357 RepID=A0A7X3C370_9LACO|nr:adhesive domain-containing protein [Secundilactobacillus folii]MTV82217.1 hypothetical protein [Secundilactobacillus folii]